MVSLKKQNIIKFSFIQICLIVPMLLFSVSGMFLTTKQMREIENMSVQRQLDSAVDKLQETYQNYYEESIALTDMQELSYIKMTGDVTDVAAGIDLLRKKLIFDGRIFTVFLYYGTDYIYSSSGTSRKNIFFRQTLGCQKESTERGIEIIEERKAGASFWYVTDTDGYVVYTYLPRKMAGKEVLVNFVLTFDRMRDVFGLRDETQWVLLEDEYGSKIAFGCNEFGKTYVMSADEINDRINSNDYNLRTQTVPIQGIDIVLYSKKEVFLWENGLLKNQLLNMVLILVGIFLSALLSWRYSRKRITEIQYLEEVAKGERKQMFPPRHIYNQLQDMIISGHEKFEINEACLKERTEELRVKSIYMIFYGILNGSELENVLNELGIDSLPRQYFVGAIYVSGGRQKYELPELLTKNLYAYIRHNSVEMIVFLYDFQNASNDMVRRKGVAQVIKQHFTERGVSKIKIGMSQIYTDPVMINGAYNEAVNVLEQILSGEVNDFCGCWEEVVMSNYCQLPDSDELQMFMDAIREKDYDRTMTVLQKILNRYRGNECTKENKCYVRYMLLHCIVDYLRDENIAMNSILINECLNVNVSDESAFIQSVTNVIKKCTAVNSDDYFVKMVEYIENNYQRNDLTFEEVAIAGGTSKSYISKVFKTHLGITYIEYLTAVRMEKARTLLRTTDYKVNDIMGMVGYVNPSTFHRCFKNQYGMTAKEYRKKEQIYEEE